MTAPPLRAFVMTPFKNSRKSLFGKLFLGLIAVMAMGLMQVDAQITGPFVQGAGSTEWTLDGYGGSPTIPTVNLNISNQSAQNAITSAYYNSKQDISSSFSASFTWTLNSTGTNADGFLFSIQKNSVTPIPKTGWIPGDNKGYTTGVSIGIENYPASSPVLQLYGDGATVNVDLSFGATGLNCTSNGNTIDFNIVYTASTRTFSVNLTQGATAYNHPFTLSGAGTLASLVGDSTSYVGFTGGTGGYSETQTISNFTLVPEPGTWMLLALTGTFFMVTRRRRRD